jgi:hypothetical protein
LLCLDIYTILERLAVIVEKEKERKNGREEISCQKKLRSR